MAWLIKHRFNTFQVMFSRCSIWNLKRTGRYFNLLSCQKSGPGYLNLSLSSYNNNNCKNFLRESSQFERVINDDLELGRVSTVFQQLSKANDCSLSELSKRTWGSIFYCLDQNNEHDKLDIIRKRAKDLGIKCGEGAYTTLIRSYVKRGKVTKAYHLLKAIKEEGLLRHSRAYYPVITGLANKGYQKEAFELFEEMQQHIFKSNKTISLAIPSSLSVSLIKCCTTNQGKGKFQPNSKVGKEEFERAKSVLQFHNQSGWPLTLDIVEATEEWLSCDPSNTWQVNECKISTEGLCDSCHQFLDTAGTMSAKHVTLQKKILDTIEEIFQERPNKKLMHFKKYQEFLKEFGPYDIVIDGMSIGLSLNAKKERGNFNTSALYKVANHFIKQDKKILVLVNTSVPPLSSLKKYQFFVSDVGYDDLHILYACAFLKLMPFIVSRDKLREHRFLLGLEEHLHYLQWIRLHTIKVGVKKGTLMFDINYYDHVVQEGTSGWHFPVQKGKWFCAQKNPTIH